MGVFKTKISPVEKELQKIEREEQKLIQYAEKHNTAPAWKSELENRIPEKVMTGLQKAYFKAFGLVFEKGAAIIEKTYDKESLAKEFRINDYAMDVKGGRKEIGRICSGAAGGNALNTVVTTVEGIGLGAFGIGLPDIVIWVGVLLRGVYETALKYGFDYETPQEKLFILKLLETSMAVGEDWKILNSENNDYINGKVSMDSDEKELKRQIEKTANAFATEMLVTKFIQGLPVVGMLGGAANPVYYQKIMRYIQLKYRKRYLIGKKTAGKGDEYYEKYIFHKQIWC